MDLSDIITITITAQTRTPDQAGFGLPLILSSTAAWTERTRSYTKLTDVAVDFAATTPEYLAAQAVFAQSPRPSKLFVGRGNDSALTQQYEFTPAVLANYKYSFYVALPGSSLALVTYTSDGTPTATEITTGLKAAFDVLAPAGFTSSLQSSSTKLRLLANTAGNFLRVQCSDPNLVLLQDHADNTVATALNAILVENKSWYGLITLYNSKLHIDAAAAWAEANKKLYAASTIDSAVRDTAKSGTDDVAESTQAAGLTHTTIWWHADTGEFLEAALLGAVLPLDPGSETWAFKALAGITVDTHTSTQRTNITSKNANFYEATAGLNMTWEGKVASGAYIDTERFVDWLEARLAEEIFGTLANAKKVPYTDKGIEMIRRDVNRVLEQAATPPIEGITPDFSIFVPKVKNVSSADKAARVLNNVSFTATLTGAIHRTNLQGTISV